MKQEMSIGELRKYCTFEEGKCYMLMLLPRKKENDTNTEKDKLGLCQRRICRSIEDVKDNLEFFEDFTQRYPDVVFRVYISVEQRDLSKALFAMQSEITNMVKDLYYGNKEVYDRTANMSSTLKTVLCRSVCRAEKLFHFDVDWDNTNPSDIAKMADLTEEVHKLSGYGVKYVGKTLNGWAIVSEPFNPHLLKDKYVGFVPKGLSVVPGFVEIKNNSMLYIGVYNHD